MDSLPLSHAAQLRPLTLDDAPAVHALIVANRQHLDRWLRWSASLQTLQQVHDFIGQFTERMARNDGFHLGLWIGRDLAGGCICWYIHPQNRNAEIGYWLGSAFLGQGLATLATRAVVHHLFASEGLHRVEMQCGVENVKSRAVPERLGFRLEGVRRESHWITTRFVDHAVYGVLARLRKRAPRPAALAGSLDDRPRTPLSFSHASHRRSCFGRAGGPHDP